MTCRHVVADRDRVDVIFPWIRDGQLVTDRKDYLANRVLLRERGLLVTGRVLKKSDDLDLALLELESLPRGTTAATLAGPIPQPGDWLQVIGNRVDLETVWNRSAGPLRTTGRLADGYFWRGKKLAANAHVLIGQWPIEEGDSGGPVFDARGEVVGMISALRRQAPLAAVAISVRRDSRLRRSECFTGEGELGSTDDRGGPAPRHRLGPPHRDRPSPGWRADRPRSGPHDRQGARNEATGSGSRSRFVKASGGSRSARPIAIRSDSSLRGTGAAER